MSNAENSIWKVSSKFKGISSNEAQFVAVCDFVLARYAAIDLEIYWRLCLHEVRIYGCLSHVKLQFPLRKWV